MSFQLTPNLTMHTARSTLDAGLASIASGQTEIDLGCLSMVDSAAVATLLAWQRAAKAAGQNLLFLNPPASLQSLLQLYDVAQLLQLHADATIPAPVAALS